MAMHMSLRLAWHSDGWNGHPKFLYIIILPVRNIRFAKKEVRRHIKVFGDPDDETIAQVRCPPLEIPAEGTA